jgi:cytosine/adenosine deaminase-related metal-dependent hydrolase
MATTRRAFLRSSALRFLAGAMLAHPLSRAALAQDRAGRLLLKGGTVLTLDPALGDHETADVLIEGARIAAVAKDIAPVGTIIDCAGMIVMPGFVDSFMANATLDDYLRIRAQIAPGYRPEDVYAGNRVSALGAINAGVTTLLDWSHISNTPAHSDAAIAALQDAGIRAVYAFGVGRGGADQKSEWPQDIRRLRKQFFASADQLLTLALAADTGTNAPRDWALAREVGARITVHANGSGELLPLFKAGSMQADNTYVHCNQLSDAEWRMLKDSGGTVSVSTPVEMQMGHGVPAVQRALEHGIRPSLSVDVETTVGGDFFAQMRACFATQRMLINERVRAGEQNVPARLSAREVLEFATVEGARANGLAGRIGSLTPGKQADVILLRKDRINVLPVNSAAGAVVTAMDTSNVDTVIIAGRIRKRGGELLDVDLDAVERQARASREWVLSSKEHEHATPRANRARRRHSRDAQQSACHLGASLRSRLHGACPVALRPRDRHLDRGLAHRGLFHVRAGATPHPGRLDRDGGGHARRGRGVLVEPAVHRLTGPGPAGGAESHRQHRVRSAGARTELEGFLANRPGRISITPSFPRKRESSATKVSAKWTHRLDRIPDHRRKAGSGRARFRKRPLLPIRSFSSPLADRRR